MKWYPLLPSVGNALVRYSFEILRAKALYAKEVRKVGSVIRLIDAGRPGVPTTGGRKPVEYGPHIPTLVAMSESGQLD